MTQMQAELFGAPIDIGGQELADIIAFVHDEGAQSSLTPEDIPDIMRDYIAK